LRTGLPQRSGHPLAELEHTLVETGTAVVEVDDEAVAAGLDVLQEPLDRPLRRAGDRMTATLVAPSLGLGPKRYADAQDDAAVTPSPAQLGGRRLGVYRSSAHRSGASRTTVRLAVATLLPLRPGGRFNTPPRTAEPRLLTGFRE
jgi:hypothetical protein